MECMASRGLEAHPNMQFLLPDTGLGQIRQENWSRFRDGRSEIGIRCSLVANICFVVSKLKGTISSFKGLASARVVLSGRKKSRMELGGMKEHTKKPRRRVRLI